MDFGESLPPVEGMTVEYGGDLFGEFELPESEIYGLIAAVIILIIAFGSVLAMGLPIGVALLGLGVAFGLVSLASHVVQIPDFASSMVAMIGLGVGIDYALFIVTRYREGLQARTARRGRRRRSARHQRPGRAVRRGDRGDLPPGPVPDRAGVRAGHGNGLGPGRADDGVRRADAAAGAARARRQAHRQHQSCRAPCCRRVHRRRAGRRHQRGVGDHRRRRSGRRGPDGPQHLHQVAAQARAAPGRARRRSSASGTAGAASSSIVRGRAHSPPAACCSCWPSRCSPSAWASATTATSPSVRPCAGPTTSWPMASVPAATARCSCSWKATRRRTSRPTAPSSPTSKARRTWPGSSPRHRRRSDQLPFQVIRVEPGTSPQDAETTQLVNRLRDDVIPAAGVDAKVGGATAGAPTSPRTWAAGCRS